jgi:hypothetical protein
VPYWRIKAGANFGFAVLIVLAQVWMEAGLEVEVDANDP